MELLKYDPLKEHLAGRTEQVVNLSLAKISEMVGGLPPEARKPQFWANSPDHHASRRRSWLDNNYHAFLKLKQASVVFSRVKPAAKNGNAWTDAELRACVEAYYTLANTIPPASVNKTTLRNEVLRGPLSGRTPGAYERRMQNITSVMADLGLPVVSGYPPLRNLGSVKRRVIAHINEVWQRDYVVEKPTEEAQPSETRIVAVVERYEKNPELPPPVGNPKPLTTRVIATRYRRDLNVIGYVLAESQGHCEACNEPAPFVREDGTPFLEVHHLRPIAQGGPDTCYNAVAVCPNCHRELHYGTSRNSLRKSMIKRIERLVDLGGVADTFSGDGPEGGIVGLAL